MKYKQLLRKSNKRTRSTKNLPKTSESQSLLDLMTTGVTTRLQRKSRNTSRSSTTSSSAAASADSQSTSNSTSNSISTVTRSSAPLPTVTVTVNSNLQSQEVAKDEVDPLCIRSMSETASPAPATTNNARRASSTGNNQSNEASSAFAPNKIKTDPDGDVVMKTDPDGNSWSSSYPPNGLSLKHEIKTEEIKQEEKASDAVSKDDPKDDKKIEIKKENEDKENEDGKFGEPPPARLNLITNRLIPVKNKNSSAMEINDEEWSNVEAR